MKIVVISYSFTGNNEALAGSISKELTVKHIRITEQRTRTMGTIILDILFGRTPQINPITDKIESNDLIVFVGPIWMGQIATPFRAYFKNFKDNIDQYAFVSISGGAIGPNSKLDGELKKRLGKKPTALIDMHIADLLPPNPKPAMKDTQSYRLNSQDIKKLTGIAVETLRQIIKK